MPVHFLWAGFLSITATEKYLWADNRHGLIFNRHQTRFIRFPPEPPNPHHIFSSKKAENRPGSRRFPAFFYTKLCALISFPIRAYIFNSSIKPSTCSAASFSKPSRS